MSSSPTQPNSPPAFVAPDPPVTPVRHNQLLPTGFPASSLDALSEPDAVAGPAAALTHRLVGPGLDPAPGFHGTPIRPKMGESTAVSVNDLAGKRDAVIADAGPIHPEVLLDNFHEHLLPLRKCIKQNNIVEKVVEKLKEGTPLLKRDTKSGKMVFHDLLFKQAAKSTEKKLFTTLEDIARRIEEIIEELAPDIGEKLEPVVRYKDAPSTAPASFNKASNHLPDGYFILCKRQEEGPVDHWIDIGVVGEFKRGKSREATNKVRSPALILFCDSWASLGRATSPVEYTPYFTRRRAAAIYLRFYHRARLHAAVVRQSVGHIYL